MTERLIIVDFDGHDTAGVYRVYPANDESDPSCDFCGEFIYDTHPESDQYDTRKDARHAAQSEAKRLAAHIGGNWATNE